MSGYTDFRGIDFVPAGSINIIKQDDELLVDTRDITARLGLDHGSWITNVVKKHQKACEEKFGCIHFKNGVPDKPTGNPPIYALLTENQAWFFVMLSRNKPEVISVKAELVEKFSKARQALLTIAQTANNAITNTSINLETVSIGSVLEAKLQAKSRECVSLDDFVQLGETAKNYLQVSKLVD